MAKLSWYRRLGALLYDGIMMLMIAYAATALWVAVGFNASTPGGRWALRFYLLSICWAWFVYCWVYKGQTVGMRAWQLSFSPHRRLSHREAVRRWGCALGVIALGGIGYLFNLVDKASKTTLVYTPQHPKPEHKK